MKQPALVVAVLAAVAALLWGQRERGPEMTPLEVHSVFPHETAPGIYQQVTAAELQTLAGQGWELVSVMPYIYRNEEHGPELRGPKPVVTQTYPAYFFKRVRPSGQRYPIVQ